MRIHAIIHAEFEDLGVIEQWADQKGIDISKTHLAEGELLPKLETFDVLITMGGPQSPRYPDKFPYLLAEIQFIQACIKANKWVIGFCLGAQLIAEALGETTQKSPEREIGIFPIHLTPEGQSDPLLLGFPESLPVMHWHGDMFRIPEGADLLAYSEGCPQQILRYSDRVYGFQCHFEMDHKSVERIIANCPKDIYPTRFTQSKDAMLQGSFEGFNQQMMIMLDRLTELVIS